MFGAIIGDIAGAAYERPGYQIKTKNFDFFGTSSRFTDDSICTAAVAETLLYNLPAAGTLQKWCRRHPRRDYDRQFRGWLWDSDAPKPHCSYSSDAAMRVSPAAFLNRDDLCAALTASDKVTKITHNHPEGMKGARATTHAIWLAYQGKSAACIRDVIASKYGYNLSQTVDEIRPGYSFDATCQGTVPQAITCALESVSFEDAVRNAVSLGGDSDTLAAIAGPIAEALHGIPDELREEAERGYLHDALDKPRDILRVIREMYQVFGE